MVKWRRSASAVYHNARLLDVTGVYGYVTGQLVVANILNYMA